MVTDSYTQKKRLVRTLSCTWKFKRKQTICGNFQLVLSQWKKLGNAKKKSRRKRKRSLRKNDLRDNNSWLNKGSRVKLGKLRSRRKKMKVIGREVRKQRKKRLKSILRLQRRVIRKSRRSSNSHLIILPSKEDFKNLYSSMHFSRSKNKVLQMFAHV